jgi:hypothetical protein
VFPHEHSTSRLSDSGCGFRTCRTAQSSSRTSRGLREHSLTLRGGCQTHGLTPWVTGGKPINVTCVARVPGPALTDDGRRATGAPPPHGFGHCQLYVCASRRRRAMLHGPTSISPERRMATEMLSPSQAKDGSRGALGAGTGRLSDRVTPVICRPCPRGASPSTLEPPSAATTRSAAAIPAQRAFSTSRGGRARRRLSWAD